MREVEYFDLVCFEHGFTENNMISKLAERLTPYTAGEQPRDRKYIKLNTNENPYPPSPTVAQVLRGFDFDSLGLYPDPQCSVLRGKLAEREGVAPENIFVGNGSDEVLAFCFAAFFDSDSARPVKFADVTYSFYPAFCKLLNLPYERVPLTDGFMLSRKDYCGAGGMVIANPNAPTAIYEDVSEFIGKDVPVIIDEAYADFSGKPSLAEKAAKSENAVAVKTFSKSFALAGLRCGYAVASKENINALMRVRDSFNSYTVNSLTQAAATAALHDKDYFAEQVNKVIATREKYSRLLLQKGYKCTESSANFLLVSIPDGNGERVYRTLKENGVLVRYFDAPRLRDKIRITVGTDEQMNELMRRLP